MACGPSHQEWLDSNIVSIEAFRAKIDALISKYSTPRMPLDKKSRSSKTSIRSSQASSSRARVKLAEEKAALNAQRSSLEEKCRLEQEEIMLRAKHERELHALSKAKKLVIRRI